MGGTHALSGLAIFLMIVAFFPAFSLKLLGTDNIWAIILAMAVTAGASLLPDLDNTKSTSKSSLGWLGDGLSLVFRGSSSVIQTVIRLPRDDSTPNPHRGFYHTIPAALLIGGLVYLGTRIGGELTLPFIGQVTYGTLFAIVITWLNIHMALAGLAKKLMNKLKNKSGVFGELVAFLFSLSLTFIIFTQLPNDLDFWWLGASVFLGCLIHILGDCFTTAGCPVLFPIPIKGKLWWTIRFTKIKAGGVVENVIFMPVFGIISVVSFLKIVGFFGLFS